LTACALPGRRRRDCHDHSLGRSVDDEGDGARAQLPFVRSFSCRPRRSLRLSAPAFSSVSKATIVRAQADVGLLQPGQVPDAHHRLPETVLVDFTAADGHVVQIRRLGRRWIARDTPMRSCLIEPAADGAHATIFLPVRAGQLSPWGRRAGPVYFHI
jgi:hypothetical protein